MQFSLKSLFWTAAGTVSAALVPILATPSANAAACPTTPITVATFLAGGQPCDITGSNLSFDNLGAVTEIQTMLISFAGGPTTTTIILAAPSSGPIPNTMGISFPFDVYTTDPASPNKIEGIVLSVTGTNIQYSQPSFIPSGFPTNDVTVSTAIDILSQTAPSSVGSINYTITQAVPGPLPILGAGAAFGFSRQLRRRVKAAG